MYKKIRKYVNTIAKKIANNINFSIFSASLWYLSTSIHYIYSSINIYHINIYLSTFMSSFYLYIWLSIYLSFYQSFISISYHLSWLFIIILIYCPFIHIHTGCSLNIVFFLKILCFFWTLPVLLQRRCSTCPVCVHTLTPR